MPTTYIHNSYSILTIKKSLVIDGHPHNTTDEPEVLQMMLIAEARVRIDLKCVVVPTEERRERDDEGRNARQARSEGRETGREGWRKGGRGREGEGGRDGGRASNY